jgi:hypothetical protein
VEQETHKQTQKDPTEETVHYPGASTIATFVDVTFGSLLDQKRPVETSMPQSLTRLDGIFVAHEKSDQRR